MNHYIVNSINLLCLGLLFFAMKSNAQEKEYQKIESRYFNNLYQISDSIYRSEQPSRRGFTELEEKGFKTVLNVRRLREDIKKAKHTSLKLERIPLKAGLLSEDDLVQALQVIHTSKKPILIHCWHGSDRTGAIIAAYRIVVEGWEKEKAIREFRIKAFGYHEKWYPNLIELLNNLNVQKIKTQLAI
ncbi:dual specificity protein phosphatase family protein [Aquimarina addita]|uniref:Dual specificity protein phosphatase family protein n=1 Tax=Aquimarina addita TaxID=870485 RepID=A0ABP6UP24_9FLAO